MSKIGNISHLGGVDLGAVDAPDDPRPVFVVPESLVVVPHLPLSVKRGGVPPRLYHKVSKVGHVRVRHLHDELLAHQRGGGVRDLQEYLKIIYRAPLVVC
eukprot:3889096-Pyramimonas_sp.AAC.1